LKIITNSINFSGKSASELAALRMPYRENGSRHGARFQHIADIGDGHGNCNPFTAKSDRVAVRSAPFLWANARSLSPQPSSRARDPCPGRRACLQETGGGAKIGALQSQCLGLGRGVHAGLDAAQRAAQVIKERHCERKRGNPSRPMKEEWIASPLRSSQ
jgi:hypothetical protein